MSNPEQPMSNPEQPIVVPEGTEEIAPEQCPLPMHEDEAAMDEMNRAIAELRERFEALAVSASANVTQEPVTLATPSTSPFKP